MNFIKKLFTKNLKKQETKIGGYDIDDKSQTVEPEPVIEPVVEPQKVEQVAKKKPGRPKKTPAKKTPAKKTPAKKLT